MTIPDSTPRESVLSRRGNGSRRLRASNHFDHKLDRILRRSAAVFAARGYHNASIRDIASATGVSLAGLYHYFSSKEELLYLIQRRAFETILTKSRAALDPPGEPEERLRKFVHVHLTFFLEHPNEMTVLTHEDGSLEDRWRQEVRALKRAYYRICYEQVETLKQGRGLGRLRTRVAVLSLFGMMNWIYTWYRPGLDPDAESLADQMIEIFLRGIYDGASRPPNGFQRPRTRGARNRGERNKKSYEC